MWMVVHHHTGNSPQIKFPTWGLMSTLLTRRFNESKWKGNVSVPNKMDKGRTLFRKWPCHNEIRSRQCFTTKPCVVQRRPYLALTMTRSQSIGICRECGCAQVSSQQGHVWKFHTPKTLYWCELVISCCFNQDMACFRCALVCRLACSSNSWNIPEVKAMRRIVGSIGFVNGSANCSDVGIHRKWQFSWHNSRINNTSKVVLYSSQDGMAVRVTRS